MTHLLAAIKDAESGVARSPRDYLKMKRCSGDRQNRDRGTARDSWINLQATVKSVTAKIRKR